MNSYLKYLVNSLLTFYLTKPNNHEVGKLQEILKYYYKENFLSYFANANKKKFYINYMKYLYR